MVYTFLIHTLDSKECDLVFNRFYTCYFAQGNRSCCGITKHRDSNSVIASPDADHFRSTNRSIKLFETSDEKNDFLQMIASKVKMHYTTKVNQSLLPIQTEESSIRGVFMERRWKMESGAVISVVWQSVGKFAFVLVCKKSENILQAQNILDIIVNQFEKYLQFTSNPVVALTAVETVSLIINQFLPSGEILFINSKLLKSFEKQLEKDLYS